MTTHPISPGLQHADDAHKPQIQALEACAITHLTTTPQGMHSCLEFNMCCHTYRMAKERVSQSTAVQLGHEQYKTLGTRISQWFTRPLTTASQHNYQRNNK